MGRGAPDRRRTSRTYAQSPCVLPPLAVGYNVAARFERTDGSVELCRPEVAVPLRTPVQRVRLHTSEHQSCAVIWEGLHRGSRYSALLSVGGVQASEVSNGPLRLFMMQVLARLASPASSYGAHERSVAPQSLPQRPGHSG